MDALVTGIHHVTAFAGNAARNRRFYTDVLGFALIKRTVNFDAPTMWHLYYGHASGAPGTLVTHFPEPRAARARHGGSEIASLTLALRSGELESLVARLEHAGVPFARKTGARPRGRRVRGPRWNAHRGRGASRLPAEGGER